MPSVNKDKLREKMLELEAHELELAKEHYQSYLDGAHLDQRELHDKDDLALASMNLDLAEAFDHPVHEHSAKLDALKELDFGPKTRVEPGAVVTFNNRSFVVSVSTRKFDCEGASFMGISTNSPIYGKMRDLEAGDTFEQNGKTIEITEVY